MRAAIVNPYLDTLGGGELYTISVAKILSDLGYSVEIAWKDEKIKSDLTQRFGIDLSQIKIVNDVSRGDGYDICFWVSDGSIPLLRARNNILHFQVPFTGVNGKSLMNKMKLARINKVVVNSKFTKKYIDAEFGLNSLVIYPPVNTHDFIPKRKENVILYVGRFSKLMQNKRQDVLIETFKELNLPKWRLILAGGTEVGDDLTSDLKDLSKGAKVEIITNPDFNILKNLYGQAKIFWSASGFGVIEEKNPHQLEHFGITLVEAMAAGCVPVVYDGGGYKEIVTNEVTGYLWNTVNDLKDKVNLLVNNKVTFGNLSKNAIKVSKEFGYEKFRENISKIL